MMGLGSGVGVMDWVFEVWVFSCWRLGPVECGPLDFLGSGLSI